MATTSTGQQLTEAHRRQQIANALATAAVAEALWDGMDLTNLRVAVSRFLQLLIPQVEQGRRKSALMAVRYAEEFRKAELNVKAPRAPGAPSRSFTPVDYVEPAQIEASMRAVGFAPAGRLTRKLEVVRAQPEVDKAQQRALLRQLSNLKDGVRGSTMRYVADGGRDTIFDITRNQDRQALGYVRVTRLKPCYFCAALASRGPVYDDDSFEMSDARFDGDGNAKVHDHCHCSLEPVYSLRTQWPGRAREFEALWRKSDGTMNGFRKLYENA